MKRHFITFLFLALAIVFYSLGAAGPGTFLLLLGALAEATFWIRIFRKNKDATKISTGIFVNDNMKREND